MGKEFKEKVANANRAMKSLGISEAKVKPVLKEMLKLYDKNWALIEEENYRALIDAIFEREEAEARSHTNQTVKTKKARSMEEEAQETEEPEKPLKRSRIRYEGDESSGSKVSRSSDPLMRLVKPKEEPNKLPETSLWDPNASQNMMEPREISAENKRIGSQVVTSQFTYKRKGKQPASPISSMSPEGHQPIGIGKSHQGTPSTSDPRALPDPMTLSYRGKGPASSQIPSEEEKSIAGNATSALCLGELKLGSVVLQSPQQNGTYINSLIKPKDEPITDDMPCLEVPLAVIYPDLSNRGGSPNEHYTKRQHDSLEPSVSPSVNEKEAADGTVTPNNPRDSGKLPIFSAQCTSQLEIASSPSGEVRIFLSADLGLGTSQSNMPTLETVLNEVEEKYLRSYQNLEPKLSLMNLMKEVCLGFLKSGSDSIAELPNKNVNPTVDALNKSPQKDDLDSAGFCLGSDKGLNGLISPKPLSAHPSCSGMDYGSCQKKMNGEDNERTNTGSTHNFTGETKSSAAVQQHDVTPDIRSLHEAGIDELCSATLSLGSDNELVYPQFCNGPTVQENSLIGRCIDDVSYQKRMNEGDNWITNTVNAEKFAEESKNLSLAADFQQTDVTPALTWSFHESFDITKGQEKVVISLVNEVNNELPPSFHYIPQSVVLKNARLNFPLAHIGDKSCCPSCLGDCLSSTPPCACAHETGGEFAYTRHGLVKEELLDECTSMNRDPKPCWQFLCKEGLMEKSEGSDLVELCRGNVMRKFIKECWLKCGCNKQCGNRVIQRGITCKLQVFMTLEGKGWGLRTLEDLPKGSFICEYVGEVITYAELFNHSLRGIKRGKHSYPVLLDAYFATSRVLMEEDALCLDAAYYGNVARFINHRCYDPNLVEIPVKIESGDHHYYHVAFFTAREVKAMEELTWDYGIDFGDIELPMQAFRCKCGSKFCRNLSRSRTRVAKR